MGNPSPSSSLRYSGDSMTARAATVAEMRLGTSMPTTDSPGTGASMRRLGAASASARSFSRAMMLSTRTRLPGSSGCSAASPLTSRARPFGRRFRCQPGTRPNIVTVGPGRISATRTSTPCSPSADSIRRAVASCS